MTVRTPSRLREGDAEDKIFPPLTMPTSPHSLAIAAPVLRHRIPSSGHFRSSWGLHRTAGVRARLVFAMGDARMADLTVCIRSAQGGSATPSLSGLVEWHATRDPDAVAVDYPDSGIALNYGELSRRANRLAAYLSSQGVGLGDHVVTCLPAGPELVVALLAIIRAGAAYVPVDPLHPMERRRLILRDCAARAVVTQSSFAADCEGMGAAVVAVDTLAEEIAGLPADLPEVTPTREDPAYICYTSGTTGTPKGVVVPHRAVLDLLHSTDYVQLTSRDVMAQAANPAFDAVTFEIWGALTAGARLVGLPKDTVVDPAAFERAVKEHGLTVLFLTTALFNQIARERPWAFGQLRVLLFGGEACNPRRVRQVLAAEPPKHLLHVYGPTETTTFATWYEITEVAEDARTIPIGRPIGATIGLVLDDALRPVAPGDSGELYLGGPCLALGYLNRPELTRERFVDNPVEPGSGRLYRTGDHVLLREDGAVEFLDRVDNQVKLRGFRIELGEIEAVLAAHPAVSEAVASVYQQAEDDRRLIAHVVPAGVAAAESASQVTEWREIYETLYDDADSADLGENFVGWNSSYDDLPIPLDQMREWRATTVDRIRELRPRRVLEIGVGTGLLMSQLAADCEEYWGSDFSPSVIEALRAQTETDPRLRGRVNLRCQAADVVDGLPVGHFDTVVINSVIQYFPNVEYLRTVVERVLPLLAPGGSFFLGDLRNLDLLRCMQTGVELVRAGDGEDDRDSESVRRSISQRVELETELLLSPALFTALARELPAIRAVDVRVKRGTHHNELTRYRYEAVLSTGEPIADLREMPRLGWGTDLGSTAELEAYLQAEAPAALRIAGVPNARIHQEWTVMRALDSGVGLAEAVQRSAETGAAPDPEELCALGERAGYRAFATWGAGAVETVDIVLLAPGTEAGPLTAGYALDAAEAPEVGDCANNPTAFDSTVDLAVTLRGYLQQQLPDYMVPAALMTLEALPLTPNGKVDRRALPTPTLAATMPGTPPGTPIEEIVRDLFAEVLGLPKREVYADSDFFSLGGHSLIAARLVARLRATLGVDPGTRALYEAPTVQGLAALAGDAGHFGGRGGAEGGTGNLVLPMRFDRALDVKALESALKDLARRHQALSGLVVETLTAEPPGKATAAELSADAGCRPLGAELPITAQLFAFAPDNHLVLLTLRPELIDAASYLPLAADLVRAYEARSVGEAPRWPASTALGGAAARPGPAADIPEPTPLPGAKADADSTQVGRAGTVIDAQLHRRLVQFAADQGATVAMAVHAGLAALLTRLGAGTDVVLATPVPVRGSDGLRSAVGRHTCTVPLRTDTSGDPAFGALLQRVRATQLAAFRQEPVPARAGGVVFSTALQAGATFETADLVVRAEQPRRPHPDADLALVLTERQSATGEPLGIEVEASYRAGAIGAEAVSALLDGLVTLLVSALADPGQGIGALRVLSDQALERSQRAWAGERHDVPAETVPELFAARLREQADAVALDDGSRQVTYAELGRHSDRLARTLAEYNVGPGTAVATAIASPLGFAAAVLAVAKAGAICLPFDPGALPAALAERAGVLLLDTAAAQAVPETTGPTARLLLDVASEFASGLASGLAFGPAFDDGQDDGRADQGAWPAEALTPSHPVLLAATGTPQVGEVLIGAEGIATVAAWRSAEQPGARSAWLHPGYPGVAAALDLLESLAAGATVLVPDAKRYDDLPGLFNWLQDSGADHAVSTEPLLAALAGAYDEPGRAAVAPSCFTVSTDRDDVSPEIHTFARDHGLSLTVRAGCPEARTVVAHRPGADGRPAWNHRAHVLDAQLRPVPPGGTGALYLAGAGLALGYANRPDATGDRFVPDPFETSGERMWRTVRAARRDGAGRLEILDEPWAGDPFEDEYGTFVVVADGRGRQALWPKQVPVPTGWQEVHPEDLRDLCLDFLSEQPAADLRLGG
ncbi:amino acid adenylation domain-containing protein [Kitasatospora sp. NPDC056181]|uniref:amino acid adenylation domain-containing protein n=1 Tax=Kitasatospora sp. NPDC056181 TaxID=3345737 RepID=UPI0035D6544F